MASSPFLTILYFFQHNAYIYYPHKKRKMRPNQIFGAILVVSLAITQQFSAVAQERRERNPPPPPTGAPATTPPTAGQTPPPAAAKPGPKPYKDVITAKAKTTKGLFTVHKNCLSF